MCYPYVDYFVFGHVRWEKKMVASACTALLCYMVQRMIMCLLVPQKMYMEANIIVMKVTKVTIWGEGWLNGCCCIDYPYIDHKKI